MADIDYTGLLGAAGNYLLDTSGTNSALNAINTGVNTANQLVNNSLQQATNYANPYIQMGTANLPAYQNAIANQGINQQANMNYMLGTGGQTQQTIQQTTQHPMMQFINGIMGNQALTKDQRLQAVTQGYDKFSDTEDQFMRNYFAGLGNNDAIDTNAASLYGVNTQDVKAFAQANINNPTAIYNRLKEIGGSVPLLAASLGFSVDQVEKYFKDAGLDTSLLGNQQQNPVTQQNTLAQQSVGQGGVFLPYTQAGAQAASQQLDAVNKLSQIGDVASYTNQFSGQFAPYTAAGATAAAGQLDAINNLKNVGDLQSYYQKTSGDYSPWIDAGKAAIPNVNAVAQDIRNGYSYDNFQNSGEYKALENANLQAQRALAAQAGASGMTGSGTMASALGNRMQENYANYFGQAQTADLNKNQAAATIYQNLMSQGLTAQQAAYATAAQMQAGDINKAQGVITGLGNVAGQGLSAQGQIGQLASNARGQDITKVGTEINALGNIANQGLSATNAGITNALNLGNQQLAAQAQQINSLYNAANLGNQTAQQLMGNYMTGSNIMSNNILQGTQAQGAAALRNATTGNETLNSAIKALGGTAGVSDILKAVGGAATDAGKYLLDLLGLSGASEEDLGILYAEDPLTYNNEMFMSPEERLLLNMYEPGLQYSYDGSLSGMGYNPDTGEYIDFGQVN